MTRRNIGTEDIVPRQETGRIEAGIPPVDPPIQQQLMGEEVQYVTFDDVATTWNTRTFYFDPRLTYTNQRLEQVQPMAIQERGMDMGLQEINLFKAYFTVGKLMKDNAGNTGMLHRLQLMHSQISNYMDKRLRSKYTEVEHSFLDQVQDDIRELGSVMSALAYYLNTGFNWARTELGHNWWVGEVNLLDSKQYRNLSFILPYNAERDEENWVSKNTLRK